MGDDPGIGHHKKAAAGHPRERFDRALNIDGIVGDRGWDELNREGGRNFGLPTKATRGRPGAIFLSIPSHFPVMQRSYSIMPVI